MGRWATWPSLGELCHPSAVPLVSAVVAMALPGQAKGARAQAGFPTETLHVPRGPGAIVQRDFLPPLAAAMRPRAKMGHSAG